MIDLLFSFPLFPRRKLFWQIFRKLLLRDVTRGTPIYEAMSPSPTGEESALGFRIDRGEVDATTDTTFLSSGNAEEEDLEDGEVIDDGPPEPEFTVLQELSGWSVPEISKVRQCCNQENGAKTICWWFVDEILCYPN